MAYPEKKRGTDRVKMEYVNMYVCFCLFVYLLTISMLHYMAILHAFGLSTHNMVTYIYIYTHTHTHTHTVSSIFYRHSKFTFSFLIVFN